MDQKTGVEILNVQLIQGDCISILKGCPDHSIDNIFVDPPYGNGTVYDEYKDTRENLKNLIDLFMPEALRVADRVIITPGVKNIYLYPEYTWILSWVNMAGVGSSSWGFSCWQPIIVYGKDPFLQSGDGRHPDTFIQRLNRVADVDHPCSKPENVMRWIIERTTKEFETILDPMTGSGSTGVACMQTNRSFIGIEQSQKYINIARKRIDQAEKQKRML
jgi:DNA modification methylase